jgi:hypothetical protein
MKSGLIFSTKEKAIGKKFDGMSGGRFDVGVSTHPKTKLWYPYGNPSVLLKNSRAFS